MFSAVALGEILVDLIPFEVGDYVHVTGFSKNFGGAPFNYAVALAKLGHRVGAVCAVGNDPFGSFLLETLKTNNVDTGGVVVKDARTTLAFVVRKPGGEREFFFYRKPWTETADSLLSPEDIDEKYVRNARILHLSGVIFSTEPARSAAFRAIEVAKKGKLLVSFDLNVRLDLWRNKEELKQVYRKVMKESDIILLSSDETEVLFGTSNPHAVIEACAREFDPRIIAVKLGGEGALVYRGDGTYVEEKAFRVPVVDTTGAGDAWAAGFEAMLLEGKSLRECVIVANAVAALTVTKIGAITALPIRDELKRFLEERNISIDL